MRDAIVTQYLWMVGIWNYMTTDVTATMQRWMMLVVYLLILVSFFNGIELLTQAVARWLV